MLIGGLTSGPLVDLWGYPSVFAAFALFSIILPLTGIFLEDRMVEKIQTAKQSPAKVRTSLTSAIFLLIIAVTLYQVAGYTGAMGRSLIMNERSFATAAISSTASVGGLVSIPLCLLIGWLSDKVGRKLLIGICFFAYSVGMMVLSFSVSLLHFYIFAALRAFMPVSTSVGSALITDLVPQESLGKGMSLFQAAVWIGGIVGFSSAGYAFQNLGMRTALILFAFLPLLAIVLLIPIRKAKRKEDA
jgi:MFS family permease